VPTRNVPIEELIDETDKIIQEALTNYGTFDWTTPTARAMCWEEEDAKMTFSNHAEETFESDILEEEKNLESNLDETRLQLFTLRDESILQMLVNSESPKTKLLKAGIQEIVAEQIEWFTLDLDDHIYFSSSNKEEEKNNLMESNNLEIIQIVENHRFKWMNEIKDSYQGIPSILMEFGANMFVQLARQQIQEKASREDVKEADLKQDWKKFLDQK
jgi:hypothetical protein